METAIDLTIGIEYGRDILRTVEEVRRRISERVRSMTGLRVTELNATISDIIFSEEGGKRRRALESGATTEVSPRSRTQVEGASGPSGYFVAGLQAVLVLGALGALITAFTAGTQWLGGVDRGEWPTRDTNRAYTPFDDRRGHTPHKRKHRRRDNHLYY